MQLRNPIHFPEGKNFQNVFGVSVGKFWHPFFGFDVIKFDKWVGTSDGVSSSDYVDTKYGEGASDVIKALLDFEKKDWSSQGAFLEGGRQMKGRTRPFVVRYARVVIMEEVVDLPVDPANPEEPGIAPREIEKRLLDVYPGKGDVPEHVVDIVDYEEIWETTPARRG